jgi:protein CrcB
MIVLLVAVGGGVGAALRWVVTGSFGHSADGFPVGTTLVNVVGSFALGLIVGFDAGVDSFVETDALTIGVLGGFTTFSTWMVDIHASDGWRRTRSGSVDFVEGSERTTSDTYYGFWVVLRHT